MCFWNSKRSFLYFKIWDEISKVEHCDMLFKTLCALHNLLIKEDGLDTNWMGFEESLQEDQLARNKFPSMLLRLHSLYVENSNSTPTRPYTQPEWKRKLEGRKELFTCNNKRVVRKMPQSLFIECLVEHFNIC